VVVAVVAGNYTQYLQFTKTVRNPQSHFFVTGTSDLVGKTHYRVQLFGSFFQREDWQALAQQIEAARQAGDCLDLLDPPGARR
jgi:extradiol dioxygenase family protein